ncbi:MAG TPA: MobA/MobL family protein [Steroidobacteraceae bacterium]|nr:MobA/MobL family protein [Steroidobacteraceae bacterium]
MASYFLRSKHISRGKGARVTRAAAYRAGERIRDERTGETYDYSDRHDVAHKEVVLPADLAGRPDMAWTQDRATLWNAAEHAGARCNSRLAREFLVLVPPELNPGERIRLVRGFAQVLADRYRCAVDTALHTPRPGADRRNHHAHLLMTVREVTPEGLGPRTVLELGGREAHLRGLGSTRDEYLSIRKDWAQLTNDALHWAGLAVRVDHRSFAAQGIDREPTPSIPEKVFYAERGLGSSTLAGDDIRARHRERLEARGKGGEELERVADRQKRELRQRAIEALSQEKSGQTRVHWSSLTREERNAIRRRQYSARRQIEKRDPEGEARRREASRQRYHASFRENPEATRQRRWQYRKAHAEEINRKQREYRRANAAEINAKRREYRRERAPEADRKGAALANGGSQFRNLQAERRAEPSPSPVDAPHTPADAARSWLTYREKGEPGVSAEQSAHTWKTHRERQPTGPTAEEAARDWLAHAEGHTSQERDHAPAKESAREPQPGTSREADDDERKIDRRRDYDLEL